MKRLSVLAVMIVLCGLIGTVMAVAQLRDVNAASGSFPDDVVGIGDPLPDDDEDEGDDGVGEPAGPLDLYVDALQGVDSNDGLSWATAKEHIQAALNAVPVVIGGTVTIHIGPGIYEEQVWVYARGRTAIVPIVLVGEGTTGSPVVLDGTNIPENPGIGLIVSDPYVLASNVTIQNYDSESAVNILPGGRLELTDCRILSNDGGSHSGIDVEGGRVDIADCEFADNHVAVRAEKSGHARFFDDSGSVFTNNATGLLAEENSSIKLWNSSAPCTMTNSPILVRDHSTVAGYGGCVRDTASDCTIEDASARCVE